MAFLPNAYLLMLCTADPVSGTISVKNASASASGTYVCTAKNRVGSEQCILHINVTPRKYPADILHIKYRIYTHYFGS